MTKLALCAACVVLGLAGCRSYEQDPYPGDAEAGSAPVEGPYRVVPGDKLRIAFQYHPEWDVEVYVRPDGRVTVPFNGEIVVAGRTLAEIDAEMEAVLVKQIKDAEVRLDIVEFAAREVYVGGEVGTPGIVSYQSTSITLLEAIMRAGGPLKESADLETVILARRLDGQRKTWKHNLAPILTGRQPPEVVHLLAGDVVLVPNTPIDQVNIFVDKYINRVIPGASIITALFISGRR